MGFSWTPITQYVTEIKAAHQNQIKSNVDIVYTDLELPPYSWQYLPVNVGDEMLHEHHKEMRDAIDYADDMNYCRSHNTGYDEADDAEAQSTVYTGENTDYDSGYKLGVDGNYDSGVLEGYNSGADGGHKASACGPVNTGVDGLAYTGDNSDANASDLTNYYLTVNATF